MGGIYGRLDAQLIKQAMHAVTVIGAHDVLARPPNMTTLMEIMQAL